MALASPGTVQWREDIGSSKLTVLGATALLCALATWVPSGLAGSMPLIAPLAPVAGIALAAVLVHGRVLLVPVLLGAIAGHLMSIAGSGSWGVADLSLAVGLGAIAALQAELGRVLLERFMPGRLTLIEPIDLGRFAIGTLIATALVAPLLVALLAASGNAAPGLLLSGALTWTLGQLFGAWVVAPLLLAFIGKPRDVWAPRRLGLALPLGVAALLLGITVSQVLQRQADRSRSAFENEASRVAAEVTARLQEPLHALQAIRGVLQVVQEPTRAELRAVAAPWLETQIVQAIGWSERVAGSDVASHESRHRADGSPGYRVFDSPDGHRPGFEERAAAVVLGREVMATRFVEPAEDHAGSLGLNALSVPAARKAIESARRTGLPTASEPAPIYGARAGGSGTAERSILVYQAMYQGSPSTPAERLAATRGVAFVSVGIGAPLAAMSGPKAGPYRYCLTDPRAGPADRHLGGAPGCDSEAAPRSALRTLAFAGHAWNLRVYAVDPDLAPEADATALGILLLGVAATSLLSAFLLSVTGRARGIAVAVQQRTAALEAEVGEREVAEAALRDSEERFRNILDNVPIGVIYANLDGDVIQANPRFCELSGYPEDELLCLSLFDCMHPEDVADEVAMLAQLVRGEIPMHRRNKRYLSKAGDTVWVQSTVSLLRDSNDQPWRIVGVVEDISEHLRLERAERAREAAEAANRAKSEFLSRMSHELRTPLNAMLGFAQLLELDQRHPLTPAQRPWVVQIQQAGWHLLEMINDVLDLSRIESGNLRLQTGPVNLPEVLEGTIALVAGDAHQRRIGISQDLGPGTAGVLGDPTRVKQILTNLLSNAVKYNHEHGRIHIESRQSGADSVEIVVTDTGLGLTAQQLTALFQPFNRLGRERGQRHEGTGIGLVISKRLAELMGGSLKARSVAGQGSSFILSLPRIVDADTLPAELEFIDAGRVLYQRRAVRYIEDNETNVEVMRGILSRRPQVEMSVSVTGLDGLAAVRAERPDLILLDMHLPDISGMELLRHLKEDPQTAGIPIVVVSADALAQQIDEALDAGADRYVTKPVSVGELLGALDELLDRIDTNWPEPVG